MVHLGLPRHIVNVAQTNSGYGSKNDFGFGVFGPRVLNVDCIVRTRKDFPTLKHPLQSRIPYDALSPRALPGVAPLDMSTWLVRDEAFAGQMAARDRFVSKRRDEVLALDPSAGAAAQELLDLVLSAVYPEAQHVAARPDGAAVLIDRSDPMGTLGRLVQEDLCILEKHGTEHILTAAVLCFPAYWSLEEKFMKPLTAIHDPVPDYDDQIARRVQRLFDGIQAGRPLWRFNALRYFDPELFQPRRTAASRQDTAGPGDIEYMRSERQCLVRLPETRAVVFSIHTYVVPMTLLLSDRSVPP